MDDTRFRNFFGKLTAALRNEFINLNYGNLEVLNNFEIKSDYNVTVGLTMKNQIRVNVVCDFNFPSKAGPKLYLTELYDSPIVNKLTSEVDYTSFYIWSGSNCKVSELIQKLEQFFKDHPPQKNLQLAEVNQMFRDVQATVNNKLLSLDYSRIQNRISPEEEVSAMSSTKLPEVIKGTAEFRECKMKMSALARKASDLTGDLTSRGADQNRGRQQDPRRHDPQGRRAQGHQRPVDRAERAAAAVDEGDFTSAPLQSWCSRSCRQCSTTSQRRPSRRKRRSGRTSCGRWGRSTSFAS